jgi:uncharacterized coiled-coil protein SlyX
MAGFLKTLAVSLGSGLILGASIRIGETIAGSVRGTERKSRVRGDRQPEPSFSSVPPPEWRTAIADLTERLDRQQDDAAGIRSHFGRADGLREELQREIGEELDRRLAAVEEKRHLRMKAATRETANAMAASIEVRVTPRISRLETEVSGQSSALAELRDCSLQSERSIQRLLTVLERTINSKGRGDSTGASAVPSPEAPGWSVVGGRAQDEGSTSSGAAKRHA